MSQRIYDEQGLIHVYFHRILGQENDPLYFSIQSQITQNCPESTKFGLTRLPVMGELLQVDRFLWCVHQVIHHQITGASALDSLFGSLPEQAATIQICFYGVVG